MRLLLLEDDITLGEGLRDYLRSDGYLIDWCSNLAQARALISEPYDAWLLDWNLPDGSGIDWLRSLRAKGLRVPALLLTARDRLSDRIEGLDSGADDFLVKPFAPEELSARLRAISRRVAGSALRKAFGPVEIDLNAKAAWFEGQGVELTAREWAILEALALRAGRIVSKADLEALVLGFDSELASNSTEVHVFKLRSKLGKALIETVRGLGYRIPAP
ncbi:DNA-binding response regulator [Malikia spinosa]|uniref:DNA-binding response regulator n=1 Tax=Malikia spinosa TaxID=86180 RepID=A0A2S9KB99_9BURK|nr:response regulator transcription factor [Malikia spinosa]OGB72772.1 MAG: DNA-binding response regulator [Burkholderiales bacterium RIFOXYC12_FULL_65_23]PRD67700.1 DNA-binding response regulator [Malikia spinosa]